MVATLLTTILADSVGYSRRFQFLNLKILSLSVYLYIVGLVRAVLRTGRLSYTCTEAPASDWETQVYSTACVWSSLCSVCSAVLVWASKRKTLCVRIWKKVTETQEKWTIKFTIVTNFNIHEGLESVQHFEYR